MTGKGRKMSSRRRNTRRTLARESLALATAVPEVVARRMLGIALAGSRPTRRDRAELHRMSAEKVAAFYESWHAMFLELFRVNVEIVLSLLGWPWSAAASKSILLGTHGRRASARVLAAGLAPVRRRAVANAKRLRRAGL